MTERLKRRAAMHAFCTLDMEGTSEGVRVTGRSRMWTTTSGKSFPDNRSSRTFLLNHKIMLLYKNKNGNAILQSVTGGGGANTRGTSSIRRKNLRLKKIFLGGSLIQEVPLVLAFFSWIFANFFPGFLLSPTSNTGKFSTF